MTPDSVTRPSKDQPLAVCHFDGSQRGIRPEFIKAARNLRQALAEGGVPAIYGGGGVGLTGPLPEAMIISGDDITGVFPEFLADHERPPPDLTGLIEIGTLHKRKATMVRASAFVALPGSLGTVEETFEAMTCTQLGLQEKPRGLLSVCDFYSQLRLMLSNLVSTGPPAAQDLHHVILAEETADLVYRLTKWKSERQYPRTIANVMEKRWNLTMRVIGGSARGVPLRAPKSKGTRPISDRGKESLFNILAPRVKGCSFLDLFAGVGGVAIEALSRGAVDATLVEWSKPAVEHLKFNLQKTRLAECATVVHGDVFTYLAGQPRPFNLIFVGPPQWKDLVPKTLRVLDERPGWLYPDGVVATQYDPKEDDEFSCEHLIRFDARRYGGVMFVFYSWREDDQ